MTAEQLQLVHGILIALLSMVVVVLSVIVAVQSKAKKDQDAIIKKISDRLEETRTWVTENYGAIKILADTVDRHGYAIISVTKSGILPAGNMLVGEKEEKELIQKSEEGERK